MTCICRKVFTERTLRTSHATKCDDAALLPVRPGLPEDDSQVRFAAA